LGGLETILRHRSLVASTKLVLLRLDKVPHRLTLPLLSSTPRTAGIRLTQFSSFIISHVADLFDESFLNEFGLRYLNSPEGATTPIRFFF